MNIYTDLFQQMSVDIYNYNFYNLISCLIPSATWHVHKPLMAPDINPRKALLQQMSDDIKLHKIS